MSLLATAPYSLLLLASPYLQAVKRGRSGSSEATPTASDTGHGDAASSSTQDIVQLRRAAARAAAGEEFRMHRLAVERSREQRRVELVAAKEHRANVGRRVPRAHAAGWPPIAGEHEAAIGPRRGTGGGQSRPGDSETRTRPQPASDSDPLEGLSRDGSHLGATAAMHGTTSGSESAGCTSLA